MIFTHIFRYLDDRDAAEELRRTGSANANSPAINSRFQSPSAWEHRDVRFKQISCKPGTPPNKPMLQTPFKDGLTQGFCSLRAQTGPFPKPRILPPIHGSRILEGEKRFTGSQQNSAKLPTIEPFASSTRSAVRETRSRSKRNKEDVMTSRESVQSAPQTNQKWLFLCPTRAREDEQLDNSNGSVIAAITAVDKWADYEAERSLACTQAVPEARADTKKVYHEGLHGGSKQEDFKTSTEVESIKPDAINSTQRGNSVDGQLRAEEWARTPKHSVKRITEGDDFYSRSPGLSEFNKKETSRFSANRSKQNGKSSCSTCNTQKKTDCLHFAESNETKSQNLSGSLATSAKKGTNFELDTYDRERRNAICEVMEKTAAPEFGLCLYDMRQNLIHLFEDQSGFIRRDDQTILTRIKLRDR